jgi:hypothetical protein
MADNERQVRLLWNIGVPKLTLKHGQTEGDLPGSLYLRPRVQCPPEIWQQVFERSIMPACLIDCLAPRGKDTCQALVVEQKKALMSVCKEWHRATKRYLYEHVDLNRPGQLLALNRCLKSSSENAALVKRLHIRCHVSKGWNKTFTKKLQDVVDRLPHLIGFYLSNEALDGAYILPRFQNVMQELQTPWPMHKLFLLGMDAGSVNHNTPNFGGLRSLSLTVEHSRWFLPTQISRNLDFPKLEHFELASSIPVETAYVEIFACWAMPALKRLTLWLPGMPWPIFAGALTLLLPKYGAALEELQIIYHRALLAEDEPAEPLDLTPWCPNLRHLVLRWDEWYRLSHHTVHWVDIWLDWSETNLETLIEWQSLQLDLAESKFFPSLRGTRLVDMQLTSLRNIPFDLPLYSVQGPHDAYEISFMGHTIYHDEGMLRGDWLWDDASDNSEYESDESSEGSSSEEEGSSDSDNESAFFEAGSDLESDSGFFTL